MSQNPILFTSWNTWRESWGAIVCLICWKADKGPELAETGTHYRRTYGRAAGISCRQSSVHACIPASCHQWSDNSAKPWGKAEWAATAQGAKYLCGSPPFLGRGSFEVWEHVKSGVVSYLEKKGIKCAIHRSKCIILWLRSWFCRLHNFLKTLSRVLSEIAQPDVTDGQPSVPMGFQISRASLLLSAGSLCGGGFSKWIRWTFWLFSLR